MSGQQQSLSLYLHIPFCRAKCVYCDFYSLPGREQEIPVFLNQLIREVDLTLRQLQLERLPIRTLFLGGGTPSLLTATQLERLLGQLQQHFNFEPLEEFSLEANPGETSEERLRDFRSLGVNRLSVGVQSLRDHHLRFMSRIHTADQARSTLKAARRAGFENLNVDLIFAVPRQTLREWQEDLAEILAFNPEHLATYSLTVEEGTALHRWVSDGHVAALEELDDLAMYEHTLDAVAAAGFETYEISNHARQGYQCWHNLAYWKGDAYLGFGPSAHSFFAEKRWWNLRNLDAYLEHLAKGHLPVEERESIDLVTGRRDFLLTRLRLLRGFELADYHRRFGESFLKHHATALQKWGGEYLAVDAERVALTRKGLTLANEILTDLM